MILINLFLILKLYGFKAEEQDWIDKQEIINEFTQTDIETGGPISNKKKWVGPHWIYLDSGDKSP